LVGDVHALDILARRAPQSLVDGSTTAREWSITTGRTAAQNLLAVARALQAHPMPPPRG